MSEKQVQTLPRQLGFRVGLMSEGAMAEVGENPHPDRRSCPTRGPTSNQEVHPWLRVLGSMSPRKI